MNLRDLRQVSWAALDILAWLVILAAASSLVNSRIPNLAVVATTNYLIISAAVAVLILLGVALGEYAWPAGVARQPH